MGAQSSSSLPKFTMKLRGHTPSEPVMQVRHTRHSQSCDNCHKTSPWTQALWMGHTTGTSRYYMAQPSAPTLLWRLCNQHRSKDLPQARPSPRWHRVSTSQESQERKRRHNHHLDPAIVLTRGLHGHKRCGWPSPLLQLSLGDCVANIGAKIFLKLAQVHNEAA